MPSFPPVRFVVAVAIALTSALAGASVALYFARDGTGSDAPQIARTDAAGPAQPPRVFAFGTVASKTPDSFVLRTAEGTIFVEVDDDSPLYREASMLREGERVAVVGQSDGAGRIEASRVFVEALPTPIRADSADEEGRRDGGR